MATEGNSGLGLDNLDNIPTLDGDLFELFGNSGNAAEPSVEDNSEPDNNEPEDDILDIDPAILEEGKTSESGEEDDIPKVVYDLLVEREILPAVEDFDGTYEGLEKIMSDLPTIAATRLIEAAPKPVQDLIQYALNLGQDAKVEDLADFFNLTRQEQSVPSEEDVLTDIDKTRAYVFSKYKAKNPELDEEDIDAMLDRLEDRDQLTEVAKRELEKDKETITNQKNQKLQERQQLEQQRKEQAQQFQTGFAKELEELSWSPARKKAILDEYNSETINTKLRTLYSDPKNFIHFLNFLNHFDVNEKQFKFDDFASSVQDASKTRSSLFRDRFKTAASKGGYRKLGSKQDLFDVFKPVN